MAMFLKSRPKKDFAAKNAKSGGQWIAIEKFPEATAMLKVFY